MKWILEEQVCTGNGLQVSVRFCVIDDYFKTLMAVETVLHPHSFISSQAYFVPMSGCGIEHNLMSITSWTPLPFPAQLKSIRTSITDPSLPVVPNAPILRRSQSDISNNSSSPRTRAGPVPPPRTIVPPPRTSSTFSATERRYDGTDMLTQLQFLAKYKVQGMQMWDKARRAMTK